MSLLLLLLACSGTPPPPGTPPAQADHPDGAAAPYAERMRAVVAHGSPPEDLRCTGIDAGCWTRIPAGTFLMGAQSSAPGEPGYDAHAAASEGPPHLATISAFWIHGTQVTASLYARCVKDGACAIDAIDPGVPFSSWDDPARRDHPITGVGWDGAARYCASLGGRLPTEAEWEYAARGTDGRPFPWGDVERCGVYDTTRESVRVKDDPRRDTTCALEGPARTGRGRQRSAFDVRGMGGNVWEWTSDWYAPYTADAVTDPKGPAEGTRRVQRGAGWTSSDPWDRRAAVRGSMPPAMKVGDVGFRCAWPG